MHLRYYKGCGEIGYQISCTQIPCQYQKEQEYFGSDYHYKAWQQVAYVQITFQVLFLLPYKREIKSQTLIVFGKQIVDASDYDVPGRYVQISFDTNKFYAASTFFFDYPRAYSNHEDQKKLKDKCSQSQPCELLLPLSVCVGSYKDQEKAEDQRYNQSIGETEREQDQCE